MCSEKNRTKAGASELDDFGLSDLSEDDLDGIDLIDESSTAFPSEASQIHITEFPEIQPFEDPASTAGLSAVESLALKLAREMAVELAREMTRQEPGSGTARTAAIKEEAPEVEPPVRTGQRGPGRLMEGEYTREGSPSGKGLVSRSLKKGRMDGLYDESGDELRARRDRTEMMGSECSTVHQSRIPVFQPSRRPALLENKTFDTPNGSITLHRGRLGQAHRDVSDIMFLVAEKYEVRDRRIVLTIDPYRLRKGLSPKGRSMFCAQQLIDCIRDMMDCTLTLRFRIPGKEGKLHKLNAIGSMISDILVAQDDPNIPMRKLRNSALEETRGQEYRSLWEVHFGIGWSAFLGVDHLMPYRGHLETIIGMRHGVCQALARYCLSHNHVHQSLRSIMVDRLGVTGRIDHKEKEVLGCEPILLEMVIRIDKKPLPKEKMAQLGAVAKDYEFWVFFDKKAEIGNKDQSEIETKGSSVSDA